MSQLPQWQCHKKVHAAKIKQIIREDGLYLRLVFDDDSRVINQLWVDKHKPEVGGYYVVYDDEYSSYSPSAPFEAGYTRL